MTRKKIAKEDTKFDEFYFWHQFFWCFCSTSFAHFSFTDGASQRSLLSLDEQIVGSFIQFFPNCQEISRDTIFVYASCQVGMASASTAFYTVVAERRHRRRREDKYGSSSIWFSRLILGFIINVKYQSERWYKRSKVSWTKIMKAFS
jgi:hypothetical protein